jgi:putative phosphoribosyl transferase
MTFANRSEAGRLLGQRLADLRGQDVVVLGLPRGGVVVAFEVAQALQAPLDVIVVRKLGVPAQPELGMGAIGEGEVRVINEEVVRLAGVREGELAAVEEKERLELARRSVKLRGDRLPVSIDGRVAVVVDDGIATGSTARAACKVAWARGAARVVLAVPVAAPDVLEELAHDAEVRCLRAPHDLWAVGRWYRDFSQTSDEEVVALMERARHRGPEPVGAVPDVADSVSPDSNEDEVALETGGVSLTGNVSTPGIPQGVVVFAHGSGSSRHSPRNRFVAGRLNQAGLTTVLFDLLTPQEELDRGNVFDIERLAARLLGVTRWLAGRHGLAGLPVGYFGASTGAAAALWAAADDSSNVLAVVSRGGRPDLALEKLSSVRAPTLLIVGAADHMVLDLNHRAAEELCCENRVAVVPGASHLFEEPGALAEVSGLASEWFLRHFESATVSG